MSEEQGRREFGRDGISGLVDRHRALRVRLLSRPRREAEQEISEPRTPPAGRSDAGGARRR